MAFVETTDESFDGVVLGSEVPVIAHFTAPWCRPCKAIEPHLAEIEEQHEGRVVLARIDIEENPGTAGRYGVLALPTVMLFAGGEARETVSGAQPKRRYDELVAPYLAG